MPSEPHPGLRLLFAGATGLIGKLAVEQLLGCADVAKIRSLGRRPTGLSGPSLEEVQGDFENLSPPPEPAFNGGLCCLGTTMAKAGSKEAFERVDKTFVLRFAEHCLAGGATQFLLVSSVGASSSSMSFYTRVKGQVEEQLQAMGFEGLHIFQPSLLLGERSESRLAESIGIAVGRALGFTMGGPLSPYRPIEASMVAAALVARARNPISGVHRYHFRQMQELAKGPG